MEIGVIGINHHLAPISVREKVSFTDTKKIEAINTLLDNGISEVVILSTCNRSEIYIYTENIEEKFEFISNYYKQFFNHEEVDQYLFHKIGYEVIYHLYKVTAGLDSMVLGEDQILGQVKRAHEFSMQLGASKKFFNKLFREAITTAKEIKSTTKISEQPLSIAYIGVKILKEKIGSLKDKRALVIGCGKMSKLAMTYLQEEQISKIYLSNRSHTKVTQIANEVENIIPIEYDKRYDVLENVDILISATSAPHTIIRYEDMPPVHRPLYMMDMALPRDIDSQIKLLDYVELYDIDDLKKIHDENDSKRAELAHAAHTIIEDRINEFLTWLDTANIDPTIQSLNEKCLEIKKDSLDYLFKKLDLGLREQKLIDRMMENALKRLIREPIVNLKQIKDQGKREEYIKLIEELFEI